MATPPSRHSHPSCLQVEGPEACLAASCRMQPPTSAEGLLLQPLLARLGGDGLSRGVPLRLRSVPKRSAGKAATAMVGAAASSCALRFTTSNPHTSPGLPRRAVWGVAVSPTSPDSSWLGLHLGECAVRWSGTRPCLIPYAWALAAGADGKASPALHFPYLCAPLRAPAYCRPASSRYNPTAPARRCAPSGPLLGSASPLPAAHPKPP